MRLSHAKLLYVLAALVMFVSSCSRGQRDTISPLSPPKVPPLGVLETQLAGPAANGEIKLVGWAGDDVGIRFVRVLLDGRVVALATFSVDRPDVTAVYPQLRHGTDTYGYEATVRGMSPGAHTITVEAVDSDGLTTALGQRQVQVGH